MDTPTQSPAAEKVQDFLINVVLDRSGSMARTSKGTIDGYNEFINGLRADKDNRYNVTLIQFDAPIAAPELTVTCLDRPLADVAELTSETYQPRGNTPLYDAIGECIRRVENKPERGVITVIITDGHENSSTEFTKDTIRAIITGKEAEGWKFIFLGANIDGMAVGQSLGATADASATYAQGNEKAMYSYVSSNVIATATAGRMFGRGSSQMRAAGAFTPKMRSDMAGSNPNPTPIPKVASPASGGRPAAPPPFRTPERTKWAVSKDPSEPGTGV